MRLCKACKLPIGDGFAVCPICGLKQENTDAAAAFYPKARTKKGLFFWREILVLCLWLCTLMAVIVNVFTGGTAWSVYVVLGAYAAQVLFLSLETAEISLIRRITSGSVADSILLWGIEYVTKSGAWATEIVIPLVLFAGLVSSVVLYFSAFRRYRAQILPMLGLGFFSLLAATLGIFGILPMRWPLIVLASFSAAAILAVFITFRKTVWAECKKKLHR